jgi:hypothetical protein
VRGLIRIKASEVNYAGADSWNPAFLGKMRFTLPMRGSDTRLGRPVSH